MCVNRFSSGGSVYLSSSSSLHVRYHTRRHPHVEGCLEKRIGRRCVNSKRTQDFGFFLPTVRIMIHNWALTSTGNGEKQIWQKGRRQDGRIGKQLRKQRTKWHRLLLIVESRGCAPSSSSSLSRLVALKPNGKLT